MHIPILSGQGESTLKREALTTVTLSNDFGILGSYTHDPWLPKTHTHTKDGSHPSHFGTADLGDRHKPEREAKGKKVNLPPPAA